MGKEFARTIRSCASYVVFERELLTRCHCTLKNYDEFANIIEHCEIINSRFALEHRYSARIELRLIEITSLDRSDLWIQTTG